LQPNVNYTNILVAIPLIEDIQNIIINTLAHLKLKDQYVEHVHLFQKYSDRVDACNRFMFEDRNIALMDYLMLEKQKIESRMIYQESIEEMPQWILERINSDHFYDKDLLSGITSVYC